ncbi:hypothetical protein VARIO8X_90758 [Burkholderiales bacterium 8X]|nr:hypothetical protein VARIO8X_90758 [Burkholderiales bacterium 8X]
MDDLLAHQPDPVRAGHFPGHGCDHPAVYADLPADRAAVRHELGAVRHRAAHQLRARAQHAAGRHHAVRRLRHRRSLGGHGDAHHLALLRRADLRADAGHFRTGVLDVASIDVHVGQIMRP